jgi:predicted cobalt transporter CbtA
MSTNATTMPAKAAHVSALGFSATAIAPTTGVSPDRNAWRAANLFAREYKLRCAASRRMFSGKF